MTKWLNVLKFKATGDGITDDSCAIQNAINSLSKTGGTLFLPAGVYLMKKGVTVSMGVNIEGETYATTGPWQNWLDSQDKGGPISQELSLDGAGEVWKDFSLFRGTWILVDHGAGDINSAPTFRMDGSTSIKKLGFVHMALPPITTTITPYPPAIGAYSTNALYNTRDGITVEDISLANPYIGIAFIIGDQIDNTYLDQSETEVSRSFGRHRIHNIMGGPLHTGILIKGVLDTIDINNIQFNYSNYESNYVKLRTQQATDVHLIRADGMNIANLLSFGAYRGIFTESGYKSKNVSLRASNINVEAVIPLSIHANGMYEITNSYFLMVNFSGLNTNPFSRAVEIFSDPDCIHQSFYLFTNCVFQNSVPCSVRENAGKTDNIDDTVIEISFTASHHASFSNCMFWGWGAYKGTTPAITYKHTYDGLPSCNFQDCTFTSESFNGVLANADGDACKAGELVFTNCRFPYSLSILPNPLIWYKSCTITAVDGTRKLLDRISPDAKIL